MRAIQFSALAVSILAVAAASGRARAQDQSVSLVINPRTGAASIRNDTASSISIDSYLLTSALTPFNPAGWTSLQDAGRPNWREGNPANNHLGELNLFSSINLNARESLAIGAPYTPFVPISIGQLEPALSFAYSLQGVGSIPGDVVFAPQNNVVLLVDPVSGNASLQNQSMFDVNIDGLLITSTAGALDPIGWSGLAESGIAGWQSGAAAANRLGEGSLRGSTFLPANGAPMSIGKAVNPAALKDETDLTFEYHVAGAGTIKGGVEFVASSTSAPVTGDYNGDGLVDAADYVLWRKGGPLQNEGVTVGSVTAEDYDFWRSRFGGTAGIGSSIAGPVAATVPEPATVLMVQCSLLIASSMVGRRRHVCSLYGR